jgi:hypothetical protein
MRSLIALSLFSFSAVASGPKYISDFNYELTDLADKNLSKEKLFNGMERKMIDLEKSICANRAHFWAYDFYRFYGINTGKIFIFFGSSIWRNEKKGWMYHVAPYIVENNQEYVMEASYNDLKHPLTVEEWIENETDGKVKGHECLEIFAHDTDLTEYFYERYNLPERRNSGKPGAKCYIRKVPGYYWFPASIAAHDLKKNGDGKPVEFNPTRFDKDDVMDACIEAASTKLGRFFGTGKEKCQKYLR